MRDLPGGGQGSRSFRWACCSVRSSRAPAAQPRVRRTRRSPPSARRQRGCWRKISAIDEQVNTISEAYDGARLRLTTLRVRLRAEQASYLQAKATYARAEQRAARVLVWLYTSKNSSSIDVILGATSLSQLLNISDDENAISQQAAIVATQTEQARSELRARVSALSASRAAAQATVAELADKRAEILHALALRRTLLVSVQAQVAHLEAVQRAEQLRLAAQARARLAALEAARAAAAARARAQAQRLAAEAQAQRLAAEAQARRKAAAAAALRAATNSTPAQTTTTSPAAPAAASAAAAGGATQDPATTTTATDPDSTTATATTTPAATLPLTPSEPLPAGYPQAANIALQYLGVPYLWGGESPSGFDCSGLVAYVYAQLGVALPHFAAAQYTYGVPVPESELQPGDLVFFDDLGHVGIYIGGNEIVDAPHTGTFVRIDSLSDPWYASHYVGARRL